MIEITKINKYIHFMAKKIIFENQVEKDEAIAEEKAEHPNPTVYQKQHLVDLEAAVIVA